MIGTIIQRCDLHNPTIRADRPRWALDELTGRLSEISSNGASAPLTAAVSLVLEAQHQGEPVAWVTARSSTFFPPDVSDSGVDLDALAVVRVSGVRESARATDQLVRSGAFGLILIDLGERADISMAIQGRLVSLAQRYGTAIVCLTEKPETFPSIGSLISLRAVVSRGRAGVDRFRCKVKALKDKRRGPNWEHAEVVRGPAGLR